MSVLNGPGEGTWSVFAQKVVEERDELKWQLQSLKQENNKLKEALRWYIEHDDTNDTEYNAPWLEDKYRAMKLLGINEDEK
jgi:hypothetical protein